MRQSPRTIRLLPAMLTCLTLTVSVALGDDYGEDPVYQAVPPVTQSDGYGVVPYAPHTPTMVTRPASWPQGSLREPANTATEASNANGAGYNAGASPVVNNAGTSPATNYGSGITNAGIDPAANYGLPGAGRATDLPFTVAAQLKPVSDATLLARVGGEVILTSDVLAALANRMLGESEEPIPEEYRDKIVENFLPSVVETKLIYADIVRSIPAEGLTGFTTQVKKNFDEDKEEGLPSLMAKAKVKTRPELEAKLQKLGSSIEAQRRLYVERTMSRYWLSQEIKVEEPITHEQMLSYYYDHGTEFDHEARAKWEQLTIRFSRHRDKQEAFQLIAQAGNQVQQGVPFGDVAKQISEGGTADQGGQRDWTTQGSLVSKNLDVALFGLPMGQLSPIIEDEQGFHIIRITEREDAYRTPFLQAQQEIKKTLTAERFNERVKEYLAKLKKETMVWTVYDNTEKQQNLAEMPDDNTRR